MADPVIQPGEAGHDQTYISNWDDDWSGSRASLDARWKPLDMSEGLHRTGSKGLDEFGNQTGTNVSAKYRRWSAWHNAHQDLASYVENGQLVFGAHLTNESDPTRVAFTRNAVTYRPDQHRIYLPFRVSWDRVYSNDAGKHITDPNMDARTWGPGHFFEFRADFGEMNTPGFRFSAYLLPAIPNESLAYDADPSNGVEIDWPEYDPLASPSRLAYAQAKVIADGSGTLQTPNGSIDVSSYITGSDLRTEPHVWGLRWTDSEIVWYLDGVEYQRDETLVPQTQHYVILSRECNSGISSGEAVPPYIPQDDGIWGSNANVWAHLDRLPTDKTRLDYFRVWQIEGEGSTSTGPGGSTSSGTVTVGGGGIGAAAEPERELRYRVHVEPITSPGQPINCRVDIVKPLPVGKRAVFAWTHGFGVDSSFEDASAQQTTLTITGTTTRVRAVDCTVTLVDI